MGALRSSEPGSYPAPQDEGDSALSQGWRSGVGISVTESQAPLCATRVGKSWASVESHRCQSAIAPSQAYVALVKFLPTLCCSLTARSQAVASAQAFPLRLLESRLLNQDSLSSYLFQTD
jgi:hypothetical protein